MSHVVSDVLVEISPESYTVTENGVSVRFTIVKVRDSDRDVSVLFSTEDGTATSE